MTYSKSFYRPGISPEDLFSSILDPVGVHVDTWNPPSYSVPERFAIASMALKDLKTRQALSMRVAAHLRKNPKSGGGRLALQRIRDALETWWRSKSRQQGRLRESEPALGNQAGMGFKERSRHP